jgi:hypothetical protein
VAGVTAEGGEKAQRFAKFSFLRVLCAYLGFTEKDSMNKIKVLGLPL